MSEKRQLIVVDCETTGLDPNIHVPLEVAAINVDTDEVIHFVPFLGTDSLINANYDALRISRYFERGVYRQALSYEATVDQYQKLWNMLEGNTFAGVNPRYDAAMLLTAHGAPGGLGEVWHYRLADLSAYVGGAYGIYPADLQGLAACCKLLGVDNECEHSALGDAKATVECFRPAAHQGRRRATAPRRWWCAMRAWLAPTLAAGFTAVGLAAPAPAAADPVTNYATITAPTICAALDDAPLLSTVTRILVVVSADSGFADYYVGRVVGYAVSNYCPRHWGLLQRYVATYSPTEARRTLI